MKTSNLVALMIALLITMGGVVGIDLLFTQAYSAHAVSATARIFHA